MKWEVLWLLGASCQSSSHFAIPGILRVSPATFLSLKNNLRFQTVFFWVFYRGVCLATIPCKDFFEDFSRWGALVMVVFTTTPAGTIPPWLAPWKCQQKLWKMASFSMIRIERGDFPWLHQKKVARKTLRPHHHILNVVFSIVIRSILYPTLLHK